MRVKLILFILGLLFIASCTPEPEIKTSVPTIYIVGESQIAKPQINTFVVGEEDPLAWFEETKQQRYQQNLRRSIDEHEDELEEFEFKSRLRNVRRVVENDLGEEELIFGYDKERDNPGFEEVDY
jgi:hypothetical protein